MSSILEALRELETDRPPKGAHTITVADAPSEAPRSGGAFIPLAGGLAVGVLVFAAYVWSNGSISPMRNAAVAPAGVEAPVQTGPIETMETPARNPLDAPAAAPRPAWLDGAEAPKARITSGAMPVTERAPRAASTGHDPAVAPTRSIQGLQVESVEYTGPAARRSVTILVNGNRVTLREGESAEGVGVQLITPDGAYLQRGSEVFLAAPPR